MGEISTPLRVDGGVPGTPVSLRPLLIRAPLNVGLGDVRAVDFDVDLGVFLPLF